MSLYVARDNPNLDMLKTLVIKGADLFECSKYGTNALQFACQNNPNPDIISYLVSKGFSVSKTDDRGRTPCMLASQRNNVQVLEKVIKLGGNIRESNDCWSCLFYAVRNNQSIDMIKFLLSKLPKQYINDFDCRHRTPLMYAIEYCEDTEIVKLLLKVGADPTVSDQNGWTSLHWAIIYDSRHQEMLPIFLSNYQFSTNTTEKWFGLNLFEFACRKSMKTGSLEILESYGIVPKDLIKCMNIATDRSSDSSPQIIDFLSVSYKKTK